MCWNQQVSWITFFLGTVINIFLAFLSNDEHRYLYLFFQLILFVQLGEALIWRDPNGRLGKIGTYISFFAVWLQPFMLLFLLVHYRIKSEFIYIMMALLVPYLLVSIPYLKSISNNKYEPIVCGIDNKKHIEFTAWDNSSGMGSFYLITSLFAVLILLPIFPYVSCYLILTMFISAIFYTRAFGSLWCWFAVFSPIICFASQSSPTLSFLTSKVQDNFIS